MRIKSVSILVVAGLLSVGLFSGSAFAKKDKSASTTPATTVTVKTYTMEPLGLTTTDAFFNQFATIINRLTAAQQKIVDANTNLATALGVATDTPLATALTSLKDQAAGKLTIAMEGTMPTLKASDAIPANVQTGLDAVNGLITACMGVVTDAQAIVTDVTPLVGQAAAIPASALAEAKGAGLSASALMAIPGKVKTNVGIVTSIPTEANNVVGAATATVDLIKTTFAAQ